MLDSISQSYCQVCKLQIYLQQTTESKQNRKRKHRHLLQSCVMVHWPSKIQEPWVLFPAMELNML